MSSSASFTPKNSVRYPAPDLARGFMLILIAVANVPFWLSFFPDNPEYSLSDQWWVFIRGMFIDHRSYPLFSMLFGFGLMTMVLRRQRAYVERRIGELDENLPGMPDQVRATWIAGFENESIDDSRRLIRRRGWWMLLFGFVHALFFIGDIIGAYALVAIVFAGLIARRRFTILTVIALIVLAIMTLSQLGVESFVNWGESLKGFGGATSTQMTIAPADAPADLMLGWYYPLISVFSWVFSSLLGLIMATILPATVFGAWLATTDYISRPDVHKGRLMLVAFLGLALGALGGLSYSLKASGLMDSYFFGQNALHEITGLLGAAGWLALLGLLAGPARENLGGVRHFFIAVGKRSMTAYVGQTVLFLATFIALGLSGIRGISQTLGLAIALAVWTLMALFCWVLESKGYRRGPLEVLLRRAVARSAGTHPVPRIPHMIQPAGIDAEVNTSQSALTPMSAYAPPADAER